MPTQDSASFLNQLTQHIEAAKAGAHGKENLKNILLGAFYLVEPHGEKCQSLSVFDKAGHVALLITFLFQYDVHPYFWLCQAIDAWSKLQKEVFMRAFTKDKPLHDLTQLTYQQLIEVDPFEPLLQLNVKAFSAPPVRDEHMWLEIFFQDLENCPEGFSINAQYGLMGLTDKLLISPKQESSLAWKIGYAALLFLKMHLFDRGLPENGRLTIPLFGLSDMECYRYWEKAVDRVQGAMHRCAQRRPVAAHAFGYFTTSKLAASHPAIPEILNTSV